MTTVTEITRTVTDTWTRYDGSVTEWGHDAAILTGDNGTTDCKGCFGVSPSGRYRVYFTWKHGAGRLGSSTVVEAASGIEAAIKVAERADGGYLTCDAGTAEAN